MISKRLMTVLRMKTTFHHGPELLLRVVPNGWTRGGLATSIRKNHDCGARAYYNARYKESLTEEEWMSI
jgi:hypothetical protein